MKVIRETTSSPREGTRRWIKALSGDWIWKIQEFTGFDTGVVIGCQTRAIAFISLNEDGTISGGNNVMSAELTGTWLSEAAYSDFITWAEANAEAIQNRFEKDDSKENSIFS